MNQISELSSVELQGLIDLCRLLRGWAIAESVGLVADGSPVPEVMRLVEAEGERRDIVPRDPVVFPLDLLTSLLTNPDGGIPTKRNGGEMKFEIEARRIIELESGNHFYSYLMHFPTDEKIVGEIRVTRNGLEIRRGDEIWLADATKVFAAFVQKLGG